MEVKTLLLTAYKYTKPQNGEEIIVLDKSLIEARGMKESDFKEVTLLISDKDLASIQDTLQ